MSTFACGGGSSMGYKLAGCEIVAANDIDPEMAWHYRHNLNPPRYFLCPIRDLIEMDLPEELFSLDILDGSPPCSTFSMSGSREAAWGKEKHFREGQARQVLSDLFFDYLDLVRRLRPKVAIAENVKGMILGNARGYTRMIMTRFREIGYRPQLFLLNAADCGVPQSRERVFFCALRSDIDRPPLNLDPRHRWISAAEACQDIQQLTQNELIETAPAPNDLKCWKHTLPGGTYSDFIKKTESRVSCFNNRRLARNTPACTLPANTSVTTHWSECRTLTFREWKRLGSFPDDYHAKTDKIGKYMIGMSVPPRLTETVARGVIEQWLDS
ncbi:MAG: DNA cytosine methyltransferase [Desulfomicrobium sp.]|nr:DNA cytosine methyltransferase [Pseudomonadota bacterium]MBV1710749.1 DNA cytosine methyltransferase [Desulfomicrobium sp.]MBU4570357.1 DNA cytosine methyltransferase [Pseudomonadota bacterium]MBU4593278.1 DNA cytosine methyltransferase [Pseudomonadota bacterium]MBV1719831.1 DNA cytosine methyltransferase [Desulfomicrobium sp.]